MHICEVLIQGGGEAWWYSLHPCCPVLVLNTVTILSSSSLLHCCLLLSIPCCCSVTVLSLSSSLCCCPVMSSLSCCHGCCVPTPLPPLSLEMQLIHSSGTHITSQWPSFLKKIATGTMKCVPTATLSRYLPAGMD
jgi:hypothetical protein